MLNLLLTPIPNPAQRPILTVRLQRMAAAVAWQRQ
jgi:hypothetical protein